jgi:glycosyltransferase involved in cell wall biosynthesis
MVSGETGLLVPPGDVQQLSEAMRCLLSDPAQARAMGAAARQRAADEFGAQKQARDHIALYQREQSGSMRRSLLQEMGT